MPRNQSPITKKVLNVLFRALPFAEKRSRPGLLRGSPAHGGLPCSSFCREALISHQLALSSLPFTSLTQRCRAMFQRKAWVAAVSSTELERAPRNLSRLVPMYRDVFCLPRVFYGGGTSLTQKHSDLGSTANLRSLLRPRGHPSPWRNRNSGRYC